MYTKRKCCYKSDTWSKGKNRLLVKSQESESGRIITLMHFVEIHDYDKWISSDVLHCLHSGHLIFKVHFITTKFIAILNDALVLLMKSLADWYCGSEKSNKLKLIVPHLLPTLKNN